MLPSTCTRSSPTQTATRMPHCTSRTGEVLHSGHTHLLVCACHPRATGPPYFLSVNPHNLRIVTGRLGTALALDILHRRHVTILTAQDNPAITFHAAWQGPCAVAALASASSTTCRHLPEDQAGGVWLRHKPTATRT
jgi:hypothetical protein